MICRAAVLALVLLVTGPCLGAPDLVFTSTRCVTGLAVAPDGALWASTRGGVLSRTKDGRWRKFTTADGLPASEALGVAVARYFGSPCPEATKSAVTVQFPGSIATWQDGAWSVQESGTKPTRTYTPSCSWNGAACTATLTGLQITKDGKSRDVPLPKSPGSHISALLPRGKPLWAAIFGDGIWTFDGKQWQRLNRPVPPAAREITALADDGKTIWAGTRREGIWSFDGKSWTQHLQPNEPYDHNSQSICLYRGVLCIATLEDGIVVLENGQWKHYASPAISSNAPRHMTEFAGSLYIRHGDGKIDRLDGSTWTRNVCSTLPRKQASVLASDGSKLFVGQWGGWSEFDGKAWTHHLDISELQGYAITAILPDAARLWIGTQGRGLAEIDRATGKLVWHDERGGLTDDWIRCLANSGGILYAGTFVGGLAMWDGAKWATIPELSTGEITALAPDASGGIYVATRHGVWHRTADGQTRRLVGHPGSPACEAQSLCLTPGGLWIGSRTGIYQVFPSSL